MNLRKLTSFGEDLQGIDASLYFRDSISDRFYQYDLLSIKEVSRNIFYTIKFWSAFWEILPNLEDSLDHVYRYKNGNILTCGFRNSYFQWFSWEWQLIKRREDIWFDSIYWFDIDKNGNIWYVIPTHDYVWIFSLEKNIEVFPLENCKFLWCFSMPESIAIYGNYAYICDMWNKRIVRVNSFTFEVEEYLNFNEPVWEYVQLNGLEIVRLESGIYRVPDFSSKQ